MSLSSAIALLFGLGAASLAFGLISEQRRRGAARRIATFVGAPLEVDARPAPGGARVLLLADRYRSVVASPSIAQSFLLATVIGGLSVGTVTGRASAFAVAAIAGFGLLV